MKYFSCDSTGDNQLIADGNWHTATVKFANSSLETSGTYFQVWFWEWSVWNWIAPDRELIAYLDNFQVSIKQSQDPKPTDFSILYPKSGDVFNLDTINGFQTIPFDWEQSTDNDTVIYTNKLVTKVPCENALVSNGFESFEVLTRINPETGLPSDYKINNRTQKLILKETFRKFLPAEIFNRPKHGFEIPLLQWFKGDLKSLIEEMLLSQAFIEEQNLFVYDEIVNIVKRLYSRSPGESASHVWNLIVFQHWYKRFMQ